MIPGFASSFIIFANICLRSLITYANMLWQAKGNDMTAKTIHLDVTEHIVTEDIAFEVEYDEFEDHDGLVTIENFEIVQVSFGES